MHPTAFSRLILPTFLFLALVSRAACDFNKTYTADVNIIVDLRHQYSPGTPLPKSCKLIKAISASSPDLRLSVTVLKHFRSKDYYTLFTFDHRPTDPELHDMCDKSFYATHKEESIILKEVADPLKKFAFTPEKGDSNAPDITILITHDFDHRIEDLALLWHPFVDISVICDFYSDYGFITGSGGLEKIDINTANYDSKYGHLRADYPNVYNADNYIIGHLKNILDRCPRQDKKSPCYFTFSEKHNGKMACVWQWYWEGEEQSKYCWRNGADDKNLTLCKSIGACTRECATQRLKNVTQKYYNYCPGSAVVHVPTVPVGPSRAVPVPTAAGQATGGVDPGQMSTELSPDATPHPEKSKTTATVSHGKPPDGKKKGEVPLLTIVAIAVGGGSALILVIVVVVCCLVTKERRKRRTRGQRTRYTKPRTQSRPAPRRARRDQKTSGTNRRGGSVPSRTRGNDRYRRDQKASGTNRRGGSMPSRTRGSAQLPKSTAPTARYVEVSPLSHPAPRRPGQK